MSVKENLFKRIGKAIGRFFKKHWIDLTVLACVIPPIVLLFDYIYDKFRFAKKIKIFYDQFIVNQGYERLLEGLKNTALIAVVGLMIGIVIGTVIAVIRVIRPTNRVIKYAHNIVGAYVALFRGTPIVVQLLVGYFLLLPIMKVQMDPVAACITIFGLNSGAYISEIMRGGINSVDPGQLEAARAVGMPYSTSMLKIVVPQAIKNILPTLGNEFIALVKETAVVGYVGAVDITTTFQYLASNSYEYMVPYLVMAIIYMVIVAVIAALVKLMERMLAKSERRQ
ncbi:MAG: amino acid ABC transporter permease [Clostridia bacterium]|nr:amino acid ABC transporter permease [Clostridia bacterium]